MEIKPTIKQRIKGGFSSFFDAASQMNEAVYLTLLTLYVVIFLILKVAWKTSVETGVEAFRYALLSIVMWGSAMYLFCVLASWLKIWKKTALLIILGLGLLGATYWFSRIMSTNSYTVVMDVFFCLMACGKRYKKMLRNIMFAVLGMLLIAGIGVLAGFTVDLQKPDNISPGHSFGINYPNTWGYIAFLALMIAWYLYLRHKPIPTFLAFWAAAAFMYYVVSCRTIALLTVVFPVLALLTDVLERSAKKKEPREKTGILGWIITALPFAAFGVMMLISVHVEWVHKHFYHTGLETMAMRFVQGGLYFRTYGLPVFGNPYRSNVHTFVNVNGTFMEVGILDSSFAAYIIMRGLFWLAYTLSWLSFAIWKALKRRDYAIPLLCGIILIFAMMERPGLDMWYNFIMLYPLAKVTEKAAG